jgi:hypothetical protein
MFPIERIITNFNNCVEVVGHNHKWTQYQIHIRTGLRRIQPFGFDDFSDFGQMHFIVNDLPEKMIAITGANGYKIGGAPFVIPPLRPR